MEGNQEVPAKWYKNPHDKIILKILIPIILVIILLVMKKIWGDTILSYTQENKWFILTVFSAVILYISWAFKDFFANHKQNLRRTWYFLFIVEVVLLLNQTGFDVKEWQRYTLLAGMFIFIDLALFLTPSIKKIGGAEMEQINEVESVNEEMKKVIAQTQNRSLQFTYLLDMIQISSFETQEWDVIDSYRESLEDFLFSYGETCRQEITVFKKDHDTHFKQEVGTVLGINLTEEQMNSIDDNTVVHINKQTVLIPYLEKVFPVVISIESEKEHVLDIDIDHIINLSLIHSWLKKPQEEQTNWQTL
ncbi:sporulation protein SpoIISA [Bacillus sp. AFS076308]|uniref:type II toxin-antitoxin system SpoIISA family toxin n=1 Tax=unclassified Bacillus (in: firmicutes) TaxID=185979 RepID=UPI000BF347FF|nr:MULTISPECIES: type II toxin-antitoxin system SpoIISA family toxin [unclassified Bacillus (in: firmicutes)]PFN96123.1 sporulation protein SpoIISA [Bacillus sp. AFS076308]PGV56009.1 sporulation protein SpoIISA [Bacillus sp. AFS037270]